MHFLITGHTGFKGAWLTLMLKALGHEVSGISLSPAPSSLYERAGLEKMLSRDLRVDIRDFEALHQACSSVKADVVIHMAAQAFVLASYDMPVETFQTNVDGTLNLLRATDQDDHVSSRVIVTSDKVYQNDGRREGYEESAPLGGRDPYSASKAMADLLTQSWFSVSPSPRTGIVRAGNVIGGGDRGPNRLVPDLVTAAASKQPVKLRYPEAIRPWQHVLDCLLGYLFVAASHSSGRANESWNVGPSQSDYVTVEKFASLFFSHFGSGRYEIDTSDGKQYEARMLSLNARKIHTELGWRSLLPTDQSIRWTAEWEAMVDSGQDPIKVSERQVDAFLRIAESAIKFPFGGNS